MKYTLSEYVTRINQTLNYPSVSYEDISLFLDQAIAELNTSLHIQIKPISVLVANYTNNVKLSPLVTLSETPTAVTKIPLEEMEGYDYYYNSSEKVYKVRTLGVWNSYPELYGIYHNPAEGISEFYKAIVFSDNAVLWGQSSNTNPTSYDLTEILPVDWITLFLIPYVCFKYSVRDGDNGTLYAEEFSQGFQQLQNAYNVPSTVKLSDVAGQKAYTEDVKEHLNNLNINIPTRAITQNMLHGRVTTPVYGNVYDNGGWGV